MFALCCFFLSVLASPFKSKSRLEAENAVLRHQLIVLRLKVPGRVRLTNNDRWFLIQLYRWFPSILQVVTIVQPETLVDGIGPADPPDEYRYPLLRTGSRAILSYAFLHNVVFSVSFGWRIKTMVREAGHQEQLFRTDHDENFVDSTHFCRSHHSRMIQLADVYRTAIRRLGRFRL